MLQVCGQQELDFRAWAGRCKYTDGYEASSPVCCWFWEIVHEDLDEADRRKLLQSRHTLQSFEFHRIASHRSPFCPVSV